MMNYIYSKKCAVITGYKTLLKKHLKKDPLKVVLNQNNHYDYGNYSN